MLPLLTEELSIKRAWSEGKPSGMVSGFASFIMNLRQEFASDYIIFALNSKGKTLRHEILDEYKFRRRYLCLRRKELLYRG